MKFRLFGYLALVLTLSLTITGLVLAQTETEPAPTLLVNTEAMSDTTSTTALEGVELDVPEAVPSSWGLFWRGIQEKVSLTFTFDPVKKAEKQLKFAEERMAIAEKMAEVIDNPKVQERAQIMVEGAQNLMAKAEAKKDKWLEQKGERTDRLLKNMATHQVRVQAALDRIEANIPENKLVKWDELRARVEEKSQNFVKALQVGNLPEKVREHLQNVKQRIAEHAETVKKYRDEKKELLEAVKNGDDSAKEQLHELNQERKDALKQQRADYKEKKVEVREAAKEGDGQAQKQLKKMNKVEQAVQNRVKARIKKVEAKPLPKSNQLKPVEQAESFNQGEDEVEAQEPEVEGEVEPVFSPGGFGQNQ